jgi:hypothetical protein
VKDDEKILYYDVCSLYPFINKYFKVPIGHPDILLGDTARAIAIHVFEGIVKIKVLPPRDLFHPVLPQKMHNKV